MKKIYSPKNIHIKGRFRNKVITHFYNVVRGPGAKPLVGWASPTQNEVFARLFQKAVGSRGKAPGGLGKPNPK